MIFNLKKDDCYSIEGSLITNNKYTSIEGNIFDNRYTQNLLSSGTKNFREATIFPNLMGTNGKTVLYPDTRIHQTINGIDYTNTLGYAVSYKEIKLGQLQSSEIMDKSISSFKTMIKSSYSLLGSGSEKTPIEVVATYGKDMPDIIVTFPPNGQAPFPGGIEYVNRLKDLLGKTNVYYENITAYTVDVTLYIIYRIDSYNLRTLIEGTGTGTYSPTLTINKDSETNLYTFDYEIYSTSLSQSFTDFSYGDKNSLLTYKLSNNELFDVNATYNDGTNSESLIVTVADKILKNYKKGKQIVTIECPTLNLEDTGGTIHNSHIFEPGQYFYILDEVGNSLFYYKLSNIPKLFELMSCEYILEKWTIILKEVAKQQ